jgi:hypothetical protein
MNKDTIKSNIGLIVAVLIVLGLLGYTALKNRSEGPNATSGEQSTPTLSPTPEQPTPQPTPPPAANNPSPTPTPVASNLTPSPTPAPSTAPADLSRTGTLLATDNPDRGNYMLKTDNSVFYIRTSRDFMALIGKKVTMTANGTIEKFTAVDIIEAK